MADVRPDSNAETREGFAAYIRKEYTRRMEERRPYEQQWQLNMAFIEGNQYAVVHKTSGEVYIPEKVYAWEQREVFNNIAPVYETRVAKLTRNRSQMTVRPASPDEDDIAAAKVCQRLLQYNQDEQHMSDLTSLAAAWSESCGTAFLKNIWNPAKGKVVSNPQGGENVPIGDVETVVCSPFEIFPENIMRPRLEDQRSLIHARAWPLDADHVQLLVDTYRATTGEDFTPSAEDVTAVTIGRGPNVVNGMPELRFATKALKNHCVVLEYYERPSRQYREGRFAVMIGQTLVYYGALPYHMDLDFPFAKIDSIRRPNGFWSKSVVERLIPLQRRYNAVRNRMAEYLNRVGLGQWVAEEGTVDLDNLTNEPGLVVEYSRGARPPSPVNFPPLPSTFAEEAASLIQEFYQISGVHEVSHAQLPRGAGSSPSGVMVAQLQEADDTRMATSQRYMDEAIQRTGRQWLLRYKEFVQEGRTFEVVGKNKAVQIMQFDATTIRSFNVIVEASSALANSPAARRDMVFAMLDRGLFSDPETGKPTARGLQKVFEMLEFGNWEQFEEHKALPQNRAQYENHLMTMGQPVQAWPWEDHLTHLEVHNLFRQTDEFYDLLSSPLGQYVAMIFEQHVQMHSASLMQSMAGAMQPTPPGPQAPAEGEPPPGQEQDPLTTLLAEAGEIEKTQGTAAADAYMRSRMGGVANAS